MTDWNTPQNTSSYLNILQWIRERDEHTAKLDFTGDTNLPTDVVRYNGGTNKWQRYAGGSTWNNLGFHAAIDDHIADTTLHQAFKAGDVKMIAHATIDSGWLLCNGQAVSRTTYSALFARIGTTYGAGDGSSTFNVPNFVLRIPIGVSAGTVNLGTATGTWDHSHTVAAHTHTINNHQHSLNSHTHTLASHAHTVPEHTHPVPPHGHSCDHGWSNIQILGGSGAHTHTYGAKEGGSNGSGADRAQGASSTSGTNVSYATNTGSSTHSHPHSVFTGTVGAWDQAGTGISGDSWFTSGASAAFSTAATGTLTTDGPNVNLTNEVGLTTNNNTTGTSTSTSNPPVLGINFVIKT